jgi:hypothetical protein
MSGLLDFIKTDTPRYKFWLARLFGKRVVSSADGWVLIAYHWRGDIYVTDFLPL